MAMKLYLATALLSRALGLGFRAEDFAKLPQDFGRFLAQDLLSVTPAAGNPRP